MPARPEGLPYPQDGTHRARQLDGGAPIVPQPVGVEALLGRDVPTIPEAQIARYTPETLQLKTTREFDPTATVETLHQLEGKGALAFDMGGKKISAAFVKVEGGKIKGDENIEPLRSTQGRGYMQYMEITSDSCNGGEGLAVGFSFAGVIDGTRPSVGTNIGVLKEELEGGYGGDFANTHPNADKIAGGNDAETGLVAGTVEAYKGNPKVKKVIYYINGGGIGGAIWLADEGAGSSPGTKPGNLVATEPGHIPVINELNPLHITTPCGQEGSSNPAVPCVERVAGSGAGVEAIYHHVTGEQLEGEEISERYQQGDNLATDLYDNAARVNATIITALDRVTSADPSEKPLDPKTTVVVCHGGEFNVPGVPERMEQILEASLGYKPVVIYTKDFTQETSGNACLDGAAILALTS